MHRIGIRLSLFCLPLIPLQLSSFDSLSLSCYSSRLSLIVSLIVSPCNRSPLYAFFGFLATIPHHSSASILPHKLKEGKGTHFHTWTYSPPYPLHLPDPTLLSQSCTYAPKPTSVSRHLSLEREGTHFAPGKSCVLPPLTNTTAPHSTLINTIQSKGEGVGLTRVFLQVMPFSRNIRNDSSSGTQFDFGYFTYCRVGFLGLRSVHCEKTGE